MILKGIVKKFFLLATFGTILFGKSYEYPHILMPLIMNEKVLIDAASLDNKQSPNKYEKLLEGLVSSNFKQTKTVQCDKRFSGYYSMRLATRSLLLNDGTKIQKGEPFIAGSAICTNGTKSKRVYLYAADGHIFETDDYWRGSFEDDAESVYSPSVSAETIEGLKKEISDELQKFRAKQSYMFNLVEYLNSQEMISVLENYLQHFEKFRTIINKIAEDKFTYSVVMVTVSFDSYKKGDLLVCDKDECTSYVDFVEGLPASPEQKEGDNILTFLYLSQYDDESKDNAIGLSKRQAISHLEFLKSGGKLEISDIKKIRELNKHSKHGEITLKEYFQFEIDKAKTLSEATKAKMEKNIEEKEKSNTLMWIVGIAAVFIFVVGPLFGAKSNGGGGTSKRPEPQPDPDPEPEPEKPSGEQKVAEIKMYFNALRGYEKHPVYFDGSSYIMKLGTFGENKLRASDIEGLERELKRYYKNEEKFRIIKIDRI